MTKVSHLIEQFLPHTYDLSLTLNRLARTFEGTATIHGTTSSSQVALHAKELTISQITIDGQKAEVTYGENDEIYATHESLDAGSHIVTIKYTGQITDAMHGLYPCYFEYEGETRELLATQFESHHAREVFPCVDEPEAKAIFNLALTTETGVQVLGNMPVAHKKQNGNLTTTTFEASPRMSTYLLAFVVGDLQRATAHTKGGVEVNIYATHAQPADSLNFALDIAVRSIEFYNDYFGIDYPLPKSDHVALPDFSSGAMENWGLITYREVALLADPASSSITSKRYIATVIAHELAHQWFGNFVTMKWWDDLWLNESFATVMEYICIDAIEPDWNIWLDFASGEVPYALKRDAIEGVQSVKMDVNHPDEISTLFDGAIVYAKGARLLRMMQSFVGTDAFRAGLRQYFNDHAYSNTTGEDLWRAIESHTDKPVARLMNEWISTPGFPVVHVTEKEDRLTLAQQRFYIGPHQHSENVWPIPLGSQNINLPELLDTPTVECDTSDDFMLNESSNAHFITHYDPRLMVELTSRISDREIRNPIDRMRLLSEAALLARGDYIPSADLLPLLEAYSHETNEQVWGVMASVLGELKIFVDTDSESEAGLKKIAGRIARDQYERLGWEARTDEPESDSLLRPTIIGLMLYSEDSTALKEASSRYETTPLASLNPELRPLILSSVVRHGNKEIVESLLREYKTASSAEIRDDLLAGITSTRHPASHTLLLSSVKDTKTVRPQDAARWIAYLLRSRESRTATWQWLQENWPWILETFAGDKSFDNYPRFAGSTLSTSAQRDEFVAFFTPMLSDPSLRRTIQMGISDIDGRIELIARDKPAVDAYLSEV